MEHFSKVTSKFQATIPADIRGLLGIRQGDTVAFEKKGEDIVLRKAAPLDMAYLKMVESTLTEWDSPEDNDAFNNWLK